MKQICPDCGSKNVQEYEGECDCLDCGVWYDPEHPAVKEDQRRIREGKEPLYVCYNAGEAD